MQPRWHGLAIALMLLAHPAMAADIELAIDTAEVGYDPFTAQPSVQVALTAAASKTFAKLTSSHVGNVIELWVDGELVSSPVVQTPIVNGVLVITGSMSAADAKALAARLAEPTAVITPRPVAR